MSVMDFLNTVSQDAKVREWKRISIDNIIPNEDNVYPISELDELVNSICTIGLEQNLVVKETSDPDKYILITGHRRLAAINRILESNIECKEKIINEIKNPMCCVISKDESGTQNTDSDKLIAHYRLHETNINTRKMSDSELLICIEDYVNTVKQLKERHILINGKEIKGETRELVAKRFGLSSGKTQQALAVMKADDNIKGEVVSGEESINTAYDKIAKKDILSVYMKAVRTFEKKSSKIDTDKVIDNMMESDFEELCNLANSINHYLTQIKIKYTERNN
jgi:ParB family chromosome partitioning protein